MLQTYLVFNNSVSLNRVCRVARYMNILIDIYGSVFDYRWIISETVEDETSSWAV